MSCVCPCLRPPAAWSALTLNRQTALSDFNTFECEILTAAPVLLADDSRLEGGDGPIDPYYLVPDGQSINRTW